jgi:hypothetical protein
MPHNEDEHVQVTIGSSKTTFIRGKKSGRLLTENDNKKITSSGTESMAVTDISGVDLLKEILAELKIHTQHLQKITDEEIK